MKSTKEELAQKIAALDSSNGELDLSGSAIGDEGAKVIADALKHIKHLSTLDLPSRPAPKPSDADSRPLAEGADRRLRPGLRPRAFALAAGASPSASARSRDAVCRPAHAC